MRHLCVLPYIRQVAFRQFVRARCSSAADRASPRPLYQGRSKRRAVILGAGLQGITTAHTLHRAGLEVEVLERGPGPACYASHANMGMMCPSLSQPLGGPTAALYAAIAAAKGLAGVEIDRRGTEGLVVSKDLLSDPAFLEWSVLHLSVSLSAESRAAASRDMYTLADWSQKRTMEVCKELGLEEEVCMIERGALKVWPGAGSDDKVRASREAVQLLQGQGCPQPQAVSYEDCRSMEPALSRTVGGGGGLYYPDVSIGDARAFTEGLARRLVKEGVRVHLNTAVTGVEGDGTMASAVRTADGRRFEADSIIIACGTLSPQFLPPVQRVPFRPSSLPRWLPIVALRGYSLSLPVPPSCTALAPTRCIMLQDPIKGGIYVSPISGAMRIGGLAEFVGERPGLDVHADEAPLLKLLDTACLAFPELARRAGWLDMSWEQRRAWCGLRPVTPDSLPIMGAWQSSLPYKSAAPARELSGWDNVVVNAGHGTMGWTLAMGSADVVANLVTEQLALPSWSCGPVDPSLYSAKRFAKYTKLAHRWRETNAVNGSQRDEGKERHRMTSR